MKNMRKNKHFLSKIMNSFLILAFSLTFFNFGVLLDSPSEAKAASLLSESFEDNFLKDWSVWSENSEERSFDIFRSYGSADVSEGSYAMAIESEGNSGDVLSGILLSEDTFDLDASKNYYLSYYVKATQDIEITSFVERADDYTPITNLNTVSITGEWRKQIVYMSPDLSAESILAIGIGNLSDGQTIYFDGIQIFEADIAINTSEVKGVIGEQDKSIRISNISYFDYSDIEVELPYYDNNSSSATLKRFSPTRVESRSIYIDMFAQTYSGIGSVYIRGNLIGQFNYNVELEIDEFVPGLVRADQDLTIIGTGFNPNNTFVVINKLDEDFNKTTQWLSPMYFDSALSQVTVRLPVGVVAGKINAQTSFINVDGEEEVVKSNTISYKVKPVIYGVDWSTRGYEHVGDKLRIKGKGISNNPRVNFYDYEGNEIDSKSAIVVSIDGEETIEVESSELLSEFNITVENYGVESDLINALNYTAKPRITSIKASEYRTNYSNKTKVYAAKVGEEITISGDALNSPDYSVYIEFPGIDSITTTEVLEENLDNKGKKITVIVPEGTQSGYLKVLINGVDSNEFPLEIIPEIISVNPSIIEPGNDIEILASGVGLNLDLAKVHFSLTKKDSLSTAPYSLTQVGNNVLIRVKAPMSISSDASYVGIQYDRWNDDSSAVLNVQPEITKASFDLDKKMLIIQGHGFSVNPRDNVITYKYADENQTVIEPRARILGVYSTEEGQEIRIQIEDDYHYGYVSVAVDGVHSNEANFGPVSIRKIARRVQYVAAENRVAGVLYISGYNFGSNGGVLVGDTWSVVHYRSNFFIIAVVDEADLYKNPVIVAKEE